MPTIYGKNGGDTLLGGPSDDNIYGGNGNDSITGGDGSDYLFGGDGIDTIFGGNGNDVLTNFNSTSADKLYGEKGNDSLYGGLSGDLLDGGDNDDNLYGFEGNDSLIGGNGSDSLYGGLGDDILDGGEGIDELFGDEGNDIYYVRDRYDSISDTSGIDTAYVSTSFAKIPSSIEKVVFTDGAQALPYWIDALIYDRASGNSFDVLLGTSNTFFYSFPSQLPSYYEANSDDSKSFTPFSKKQIARSETALKYISTLLDVKFEKTSSSSSVNTISFANNRQSDSAAYAYAPSTTFFGSDIFLDLDSDNASISDGTYAALTLIHELGHALGLKHAGSAGGATGNPPFLTTAEEDNTNWTVMSYESNSNQYYLRYSELDIAALQYLYGPSTSSRTSNDTYKVSQSTANFIWDGSGVDTIDISSVSLGSTIYLTPGYWGFIGSTKASKITSAGQITVNFGTKIENLIGSSYADKLYGNDLSNSIVGGLGNDLLEGLDGNDTFIGGQGNDQIFGGAGVDIAQFNGIVSSYSISKNQNSLTVSDRKTGLEGTDSLVSVERLRFSDKYIAFDLDANAGVTAKVMGAVLNKNSIKNSKDFGFWLSQADNGLSYSAIGQKALDITGLKTYDQIVSTLWKNVIGFTASETDKAPYIKMLVDGMKPGDLVVLAADTTFNTSNINLGGLAQTGIEFIPVV